MKKYIQKNNLQGSGQTMVAYASGANMNFDRLRFVAERAELGEKREALLSVIIPEKAGSFIKLHSHIHPRTTTEFSYRCNNTDEAHIFCSFLLSAGSQPGKSSEQSEMTPQEAKAEELANLIGVLEEDGFKVRDLADDELAKAHARYLVGGRANISNERLIRFEFPERPGALRKFLVGLHAGWNISLFHYRNQGGGRCSYAVLPYPRSLTQPLLQIWAKCWSAFRCHRRKRRRSTSFWSSWVIHSLKRQKIRCTRHSCDNFNEGAPKGRFRVALKLASVAL